MLYRLRWPRRIDMGEHGHTPVLAAEVERLLSPKPGEVVVDCTLGRGGHAVILARAVRSGAAAATGVGPRLIGFDLDAGSLAYAGARLEPLGVPPPLICQLIWGGKRPTATP